MDKKSKLISVLKPGEIIVMPDRYFSDSQKRIIIEEFLSSRCTKREIWRKYTGHKTEHGSLLRWMRNLGYDDSLPRRMPKFAYKSSNMDNIKDSEPNTSFDNLQLKKRIEELEKQLKESEMKAIAFSTMVDIAEKEFNIPIRKKYNTKPSKQ